MELNNHRSNRDPRFQAFDQANTAPKVAIPGAFIPLLLQSPEFITIAICSKSIIFDI